MSNNPVAKFMNRVNRPSTHKNENKSSQKPIEDSEGCHVCGSLHIIEGSLEPICKLCKEAKNDY